MLNVGTGKAGFVRGFLLAGSAAAALCVPGIALAQDDDAAAAMPPPPTTTAIRAEEDASTGNAILVTATKRERTLQDTPGRRQR